jgi:uncharacterized Zn-finger protein
MDGYNSKGERIKLCDGTDDDQLSILETGAKDSRTPKKHPCPESKQYGCKRMFTTYRHAIRHAVIHTDQKLHACSMCGRRYNRRDNMLRHERTHPPDTVCQQPQAMLSRYNERPVDKYNNSTTYNIFEQRSELVLPGVHAVSIISSNVDSYYGSATSGMETTSVMDISHWNGPRRDREDSCQHLS